MLHFACYIKSERIWICAETTCNLSLQKIYFFACHTSPIIWFFRFFLLSLSLDVNGDVWLSVAVIVGLWSV